MEIVILGAGTVGTSIADLLCQNRHDVTVIDRDPEQILKNDNSRHRTLSRADTALGSPGRQP